VVERAADLAASYMVAGFVHGVLNSDNINITGESFDYGPWRFTEYWDPRFTAAYFDETGLYAFGRQAEAIHWDVGQLAVALRLLSEAAPLIEALERFPALYQTAIIRRFLWRLGVEPLSEAGDRALIEAAERAMVRERVAIDRFFHDHRGGRANMSSAGGEDRAAFAELLTEYRPVSGATDDPYWSVAEPCSMLIDEVETIWAAIAERDDWQPLMTKVDAIRAMGDAHQTDAG
jgi:serine/tyrosine/threonine adenylyltransferase